MSDSARRRYAALLAAEFRESRREAPPLLLAGDLAHALRPVQRLYEVRHGTSEEAWADFREEVAEALSGGDRDLLPAALAELAAGEKRAGSRSSRDIWRRLWSEVVGGAVVLGLGLMIAFGTARSTLRCERGATAVSCRLQWHALFGALPLRDTGIASLEGADQRRERSGVSGRPDYYRVALTADDGTEVYFLNARGTEKATRTATEQIEAFLAEPSRARFELVVPATGLAPVGDVLLLLGLSFWAYVPYRLWQVWSS